MTHVTSNVLPFPSRHIQMQTAPQPLAAEPGVPDPRIADNKDLVANDEYREHVATIVGVAIRSGRRKGRSLSSLQPQLRKWLAELCDQSDPSAMMVHDWLTGNHRHLPPGFDDEAKRQRTTKHDVEMGEDA